jgi:transcriptional accessory protein Tex/SPT6
MSWLVHIYNDLKSDFDLFLHLYRRIKKEGLNKQDITDLIQNQQRLKGLDDRVQQYCKFIREQQLQKQQLEQIINRLQSRIDSYDGIHSI